MFAWFAYFTQIYHGTFNLIRVDGTDKLETYTNVTQVRERTPFVAFKYGVQWRLLLLYMI
jgi:hypothetical protein